MNQVLTFLRGKKTYILVACALVIGGLDLSSVISDDAANTALGMLGFGTMATLRSGIKAHMEELKAAAVAQAAPAPSAPPAKPAA